MSSTGSLSRLQTASGLITVVLMFVIGCQRQDSSASSVSSDHQVAHYVRRGSGARVIVFVHGIFGGATSTWSYSSAVSWPDMLKSDSIFDGSDIYVASYDSPYHGNQMTIDEVVESLNSRFDSDKVFAEHREVVFVAHSLGGLVVQRYLLTRRELANQVSFIYFFSTPETGANVAKLGRVFNADPLLKEMLPGDSNDYLLNMEFLALPSPSCHQLPAACSSISSRRPQQTVCAHHRSVFFVRLLAFRVSPASSRPCADQNRRSLGRLLARG
jgi:pimeloyl-ACP methyl ester carboxylesterase